MLMNHMLCNSEEIRFRISNGIVLLNAEQPQKHLLRDIRDVVHVAQPHRQKAPQPPPVTGSDLSHKAFSIRGRQIGSG